MSNLCEVFETPIPETTMTIETRVYEDGYILAAVIDEFGSELNSLDGQERYGHSRAVIEDYLLDQYVYN